MKISFAPVVLVSDKLEKTQNIKVFRIGGNQRKLVALTRYSKPVRTNSAKQIN
jgi:hypothetical protein